MSRYIRIADDEVMETNLFDFTEYPSNITIEDNDNPTVLNALDGEGVLQYNFVDVREFEIIFESLKRSTHDKGAGTLINELKDRKFKITGNNYYLRYTPEVSDIINDVTDDVISVDTGGMVTNAYQYMDLVCDDDNGDLQAFFITSNDADSFTVELDGRVPDTGACYVIDRAHNPLKISTPIKMRINDIEEKLVPNTEEAFFDVVVKCQKVV